MHFSLLKLPASFPAQNRAARFNSKEPYRLRSIFHGSEDSRTCRVSFPISCEHLGSVPRRQERSLDFPSVPGIDQGNGVRKARQQEPAMRGLAANSASCAGSATSTMAALRCSSRPRGGATAEVNPRYQSRNSCHPAPLPPNGTSAVIPCVIIGRERKLGTTHSASFFRRIWSKSWISY